MVVRARQLELKKRCSACLEERLAGDSCATNEAAALRRTAWREKKDKPVRASQLEREEERDRDEKAKLLEVGQAGGKRATNEVVVLTRATMREKEDRSVRARQLEREKKRRSS